MTPEEIAAVMAAHGDPNRDYRCEECREPWPCLPYRLAEALAASEAKVARMLDLGRFWNGPGHGPGRWDSSHAIELRKAAEGTLDWSTWDEMAGRWATERGLDQPEEAANFRRSADA